MAWIPVQLQSLILGDSIGYTTDQSGCRFWVHTYATFCFPPLLHCFFLGGGFVFSLCVFLKPSVWILCSFTLSGVSFCAPRVQPSAASECQKGRAWLSWSVHENENQERNYWNSNLTHSVSFTVLMAYQMRNLNSGCPLSGLTPVD